MKITILYENCSNPQFPLLEKGWGLSALIELRNKTILFDTGWNGNILIRNAKKLNIDLTNIDEIFISHPHWDHTGGLSVLLENAHPKKIYLPYEYSKNQLKEIQLMDPGIDAIICKDKTILDNSKDILISTGSKKGADIYEHSLVIKPEGAQKSIIMIGCCHPGLFNLLNEVNKEYPIEIIFGGLHDFKDIDLIQLLNIKKMIIGHCTENLNLFKSNFSIIIESTFVGLSFEL